MSTKEWGVPAPIENGDAIAVWAQNDGAQDNVWASYYRKGIGWEPPELLETSLGNASFPKIAINNDGGAIVIWEQWDFDPAVTDNQWHTKQTDIWANYYIPNIGWKGSEIIEPAAGGATSHPNPELVIDANGNAMILWAGQRGQQAAALFSKRYVNGIGWDSKTQIDDAAPATAVISAYQLAMNKHGNAVALWVAYQGNRSTLFEIQYSPETGWGTPTTIAQNDNGIFSISYPKAAIDKKGNILVIWEMFTGPMLDAGTKGSVWTAYFTAAVGWGMPEFIEGDAIRPDVAMDNNGNAFVVWSHWYGGYNYGDRRVKRFVRDSGWKGVSIALLGISGVIGSDVAVSDDGRAITTWVKSYSFSKEEFMASYFQ